MTPFGTCFFLTRCDADRCWVWLPIVPAHGRFCYVGSCAQSRSCAWLCDPHALEPTRLLCPWNFPGKNTGVGCHFLPQEIFPTQGSNPGLPRCRQTLYHLSHQGSPFYSYVSIKWRKVCFFWVDWGKEELWGLISCFSNFNRVSLAWKIYQRRWFAYMHHNFILFLKTCYR